VWLLPGSAARRGLLPRLKSKFLSSDQVSKGNDMYRIGKHLVYLSLFATLLLLFEVASAKDGNIVSELNIP
jgi:hypothetical protein